MNTFALDNETVEEHVANNNGFFQQTHYTLDDLDVYKASFAPALQAVYSASEGSITDQQLFDAIKRAVESLKAIHATMV